jgi:hypothetical protein
MEERVRKKKGELYKINKSDSKNKLKVKEKRCHKL